VPLRCCCSSVAALLQFCCGYLRAVTAGAVYMYIYHAACAVHMYIYARIPTAAGAGAGAAGAVDLIYICMYV